jgi:hypothetical protein
MKPAVYPDRQKAPVASHGLNAKGKIEIISK